MDGESEALRLIAEERERKTGRLDLGNLGLSELPKELFQLTHLTWLNLGVAYTDASGGSRRSSNQGALNVITSIPGELGCLRNLKEIHLRILPIRNIELF